MKIKSLITLSILLLLTIFLVACNTDQDVTDDDTTGTQSSEEQESSTELDLTEFNKQKEIAAKTNPSEFGGPTVAVKAPNNIKAAIIPCYGALTGCSSPAKAAKEAAEKLGWAVTEYDGGGTADQQNKAILNAISAGVDIILTTAIDPALVQQGLKAANDAGIPVIGGNNGIASPNPEQQLEAGSFKFAADVSVDYAALGEAIANWIISDSKGKANILVYTDKEFTSVLALEKGLLKVLEKCTTCKIHPLENFSATQISTTLGKSTVGILQSKPEINYIFSPYDSAAAAQIASMRQAGYADKVKVIGVLGSQQNIEFIRNGDIQVADGAYDNDYTGYAMVDQAIRVLTDTAIIEPQGENVPYIVLDETNLPEKGYDWLAEYDYKSKYLELWGVQ